MALIRLGLGYFLPPIVAAVLAAGCWVVFTGGLHLDGLADCCDGMMAAATPERRLAIMKDSRLGTFGGAGLALHLMLKVALLSSMSSISLALTVPMAACLGRWMVLLVVRQPLARSAGLGEAFVKGMNWKTLAAASILPFGFVTFAGLHGLAGLVATCLIGLLIIFLARRRLGGMTGDVFGLLIEISEIVVLLVFAVQWSPVSG